MKCCLESGQNVGKNSRESNLLVKCPRCGPKRKRRDIVKKDLNINVGTWYDTALNRGEWHKSCTEGVTNYQSAHHKKQRTLELREVRCDECRRAFRREADKAQNKCLAE